MQNFKNLEAKEILDKIYRGNEILSREHYQMLLDERIIDAQAVSLTVFDLFSKKYRYRTLMGIMTVIFFQLTGVFVILDYSTPIFLGNAYNTGATPTAAMYDKARTLSVLLGTLQLLASIPPAFYLRHIGRKPVLWLGFATMAVTYIIYEIWPEGVGAEVAILLFVVLLNSSIGSVAWIYIPEILPDYGVAFSFLVFWGMDTCLIFLFPVIVTYATVGGAFYIFLAGCVLGVIWVLIFVKETKDKTNKEIVEMYCPEEFHGVEDVGEEEEAGAGLLSSQKADTYKQEETPPQ
jgi:hypothetical protein